VSTFVILLRGVNVGGRNRLPMADLRAALTSAGLAHVRTYIQSGNIVASAPAHDPEAVAAHVRAVIARTFHLDVPVIALTAADLEALVDANPYADEPDSKRVHAIVLPYPPTEAMLHGIEHRRSAAAAAGSPDAVTVVGRTAYLHTPEGFGTSRLATALLSGGSSPLADGTARNWATVTALLAMLVDS
jgi:uncharacterized protein (DUF1697 family)